MTDIKDFPFTSLQFYATAPYPCSYLPNLDARSQVATPHNFVTPAIYGDLIHAGFRRSGHFTYRPYCDHCKACIASRIPVKSFIPSRSQSRALKKHQDLEAKVMPLQFKEEHFLLYQNYQKSRHPSNDGSSEVTSIEADETQYRDFLIQSHIETFLIEFRFQSALKMISVIDLIQDGVSSVYTFYDTSDAHSSYGTYGVLWQIAWAKELQLPYVYLGYYIEGSRKMSYKIQYQPLEGLVDGDWKLLSSPLTT